MAGAAYITGLSAFLPNKPIANDEMEAVLGKVNGQPSRARRIILRSNGIKTRHYVIDSATGEPTHTNAQLTAAAVRGLANDHFQLNRTDLLACGTSLADQIVPSHASMVHGELGIPPCEILSTSGVCASSISALKYAMLGVRAGEFQHAVSTGSEIPSVVMQARHFEAEGESVEADLDRDPALAFHKDFIRWMLSDGAGAALVEPAPASTGVSLRLDWIDGRSYANEQPACMYGGAEKRDDGRLKGWPGFMPEQWAAKSVFTLKQDVRQLNTHILHYTIERPLHESARLKMLRGEDVDWFVPHYSSHYFRELLHESMYKAGLDIPFERWFTNLYSKGNTGSASMYIMLEELFKSGRLEPGQRVLCYIPESGRFTTVWMHLTVCGPAAGT